MSPRRTAIARPRCSTNFWRFSDPSPKSFENDRPPVPVHRDGAAMISLLAIAIPLAAAVALLAIMALAPAMSRAQGRRLAAIRGRHNVNGEPAVNEQVRKLLSSR